MNWLRLLVVMVAMVGCPAASTVLHNENTAKVQSVDLQHAIVDVSAADSSVFTDDEDNDFDGYVPALVSTLGASFIEDAFTLYSRETNSFSAHHPIRAPPFLS